MPHRDDPENAFMALPGRSFEATATMSNGDWASKESLIACNFHKDGIQGSVHEDFGKRDGHPLQGGSLRGGESHEPYWHRDDPETEALNTIDDRSIRDFPSRRPVGAIGTIPGRGPVIVLADCMVRYKDETGAVSERPLAVAPAFSVLLDPGEQLIPTQDGPHQRWKVDVASNLPSKR